jgi:hypothetical protein
MRVVIRVAIRVSRSSGWRHTAPACDAPAGIGWRVVFSPNPRDAPHDSRAQ